MKKKFLPLPPGKSAQKDTETTDKPAASADKISSKKATESVTNEDKDFTKIVNIVAGKTSMPTDYFRQRTV